ncbi:MULTISPECIES: hypothetical protein [unclassified Planococcus (in: firmicutes)]|uniref:hypothetical protein n=1 Tax=unclassified Planococcus (in: firmicutes) TaxID=2662419 RepID=UPI000C339CE1|nr:MULTISPECIES: hypothetical protein [unclassified Planococcus (in: firmicutes)]AUD12381.1 hypothetical protein CW734_00445 [Planococcus sp. MB-3u-03]PKG46534.1 hypothetical protein CXF66_06565 [Planococcus sp. Urea-trap-24]PKG89780.1 hypothetical protein CXF91_06240 [Planococcus sp. Urea-3u-39]PKH40817.1 hypothetical protein CXF77_07155 [Planococcus sp. MB-3u-09]
MDYIFWTQVFLFTIITLELMLRLAAPFIMPVGTTSFSEQLHIIFIFRAMITTYIALNLESISNKIAALLPEQMAIDVTTYPIWLLPLLAYSVYAITVQSKEKKKTTS